MADAPLSSDLSEGSTYRPIGEVATLLRLQPHVLRFWETKFKQISPLKRSGGRRYYRREDVRLLFAIRDLLYVEGYTLRGAQKALRERTLRANSSASSTERTRQGAGSAQGATDDGGVSALSQQDTATMAAGTRTKLEVITERLEQTLAQLDGVDSGNEHPAPSVPPASDFPN